jgi:hypothetical protein
MAAAYSWTSRSIIGRRKPAASAIFWPKSYLGTEGLSEGQRQLARRAALMCLKAELLEADCVSGNDIDVDLFGQLSDRIGRAFMRPGLKRVSRDIEDNPLLQYFSRPFQPDPEPRTANGEDGYG